MGVGKPGIMQLVVMGEEGGYPAGEHTIPQEDLLLRQRCTSNRKLALGYRFSGAWHIGQRDT
jgi:hypothetical protein